MYYTAVCHLIQMRIVDGGPNFVFKKLKLFSAAALHILKLFHIFKKDSVFQIGLLYKFEIKFFIYSQLRIKQNYGYVLFILLLFSNKYLQKILRNF